MQAKTAKLTTSTIQPVPAQQKFPLKIDFLLCLGRVHLQLTPRNYAQIFFSRTGGERAPSDSTASLQQH